jgi:hypothetical protein
MDEEDFDYVPSWAQRRTSPPLTQEYRPVDRDFADRIFRMFARPFDPTWEMPDLDGPEFRQPRRRPKFDPDNPGNIQPLPYYPGQEIQTL